MISIQNPKFYPLKNDGFEDESSFCGPVPFWVGELLNFRNIHSIALILAEYIGLWAAYVYRKPTPHGLERVWRMLDFVCRYPWIRWEWWVLSIQLTGQSISLSGQLREELTGAMWGCKCIHLEWTGWGSCQSKFLKTQMFTVAVLLGSIWSNYSDLTRPHPKR